MYINYIDTVYKMLKQIIVFYSLFLLFIINTCDLQLRIDIRFFI